MSMFVQNDYEERKTRDKVEQAIAKTKAENQRLTKALEVAKEALGYYNHYKGSEADKALEKINKIEKGEG